STSTSHAVRFRSPPGGKHLPSCDGENAMIDHGTTAGEKRPMNLLIVDDSAMMRNMIKRVLGMTDLRVGTIYEAGNGREALDVLETHDVEVLLTDINMPVMSGTELLRILAA